MDTLNIRKKIGLFALVGFLLSNTNSFSQDSNFHKVDWVKFK